MNWAVFFTVVCLVESGADNAAVGDLHLKNKAYGAAQIRLPYLKDVNRLYHREVMHTFGRKLTIRDMHDPVKADWVVRRYIFYYGVRYSRETGKPLTYEVAARLHNGGPSGWRWWHVKGRNYWDRKFKPVLIQEVHRLERYHERKRKEELEAHLRR